MVKTSAAGTTLKGGGSLLGRGDFHCICEAADAVTGDQDFNRGQVQVKMKMVAYAPDEAQGKVAVEFLPAEGETREGKPASSRLWQFAVAVGVVTVEEWEEFQKSGAEVDIDENLFVGRQFFVSRSGKTDDKVYSTFYALNDPKAAKFPRSKELLDLLTDPAGGEEGGSAGTAAGSGNGNGGGGQAQPAGAGAGAGFNDPDM